jgi:hypothetical protein
MSDSIIADRKPTKRAVVGRPAHIDTCDGRRKCSAIDGARDEVAANSIAAVLPPEKVGKPAFARC